MSIDQEKREGFVYIPLDVEALKVYKKMNPSKFAHKFGDLDLDNLPPNFDLPQHRRNIIAGLPITPIMKELELPKNPTEIVIEQKVVESPQLGTATPAKVETVIEQAVVENPKTVEVPENVNEEIAASVDGGETLKDNQVQ